jgi:hypothetical protein
VTLCGDPAEMADRTDPRFRLARRLAPQVSVDCLAWASAMTLAVVMRFEFNVDAISWTGFVLFLPWCCWFLSWRGSSSVCTSAGGATAASRRWRAWPRRWGRSAGPVRHRRRVKLAADGSAQQHLYRRFHALVLMGGVRYAGRLEMERRKRPSAEVTQRIVVFGAGEGGARWSESPGTPRFLQPSEASEPIIDGREGGPISRSQAASQPSLCD